MANFLQIALEYHASGLRVIPFWKSEAGKVSFPEWTKWQTQVQTDADVTMLFSKECFGVAMICSDGIEAVDIDVKHDPSGNIGKDYFDYLKMYVSGDEALMDSIIQKTKSGGWHIIYKTNTHAGNQKLAHLDGSKEAVIETRGKGGLLFVHPTPGYEVKRGDLKNIKLISDKGRECFMRCAREMSTRVEVESIEPTSTLEPEERQAIATHTTLGGVRPGADYNSRHDVLETAEKYGWKLISRHGGTERLTRPGSASGDVHATIVRTKEGERRFYPFTTSTGYDAQKCYSSFSMYALEEHKGDQSAAAKALYSLGYGSRVVQGTSATATDATKNDLPVAVTDILEAARKTKFDFHAPIPNPDAVLTLTRDGKTRKVGGFGQIGLFTGEEKSGKSYVLSCIVASALGKEVLGFKLDLRGRKMKLLDTEQALEFYALTQRRIHNMAGLGTNPENYEAYHLRQFSVLERLAIIEHFINETPDLGVLVIDGFVDLILNYNDLAESNILVSRLMKWSYERNILILGILHLNKGDGKMRGHIGSELKNKCDFLIKVARNEREYSISNPFSRYGEFSPVDFSRDERGDLVGFDAQPAPQFQPMQYEPIFDPSEARPNVDEDVPF